MLVTLLIFMFIEDPVLGVAAIALYPVQAWLIPKLQRRLNERKKERIRLARALSERIGEVVTGIREIHTHDTSRLERADYTERVGEIYRVRVQIYRLKFFIKFVNNFIAQITPFFFYSIGGYLVIRDDLTFGSLVAVIAAYEKLAGPWKELLNFYQVKEDAKGKYELLLESFQVPGMLDQEQIDAEPAARAPIAGALVATNLDLKEEDESETTFPGGLTLTAELPASIAIVGGQGSGSDRLAHIIAGLKRPGIGKLLAGAVDLIASPESVTGRRIAYVGSETSLFSGTLRDNLFYSLKHRPTGDAAYDDPGRAQWERRRSEAERAGNSLHDVRADWIDYAGAGVEDAESMNARAIEVLSIVDMDDDIYRLGLQSSVDPGAAPELARGVLEARRMLRVRLADLRVAHLVDPFDRGAYNVNMTVAENLLFGTPRDRTFDPENLAGNSYVRKVLDDVGLMDDFLDIGRQVAKVMVDLFTDVEPGSELFEQFSFISAEDLPEFRHLLARTESVRRGRSRRRRPDHVPVAHVQARARAPSARAHRRADARAPGPGSPQVLGGARSRSDGHRAVRLRALQRLGLDHGQHPLRAARLRAPAQCDAHRRGDRARWWTPSGCGARLRSAGWTTPSGSPARGSRPYSARSSRSRERC